MTIKRIIIVMHEMMIVVVENDQGIYEVMWIVSYEATSVIILV